MFLPQVKPPQVDPLAVVGALAVIITAISGAVVGIMKVYNDRSKGKTKDQDKALDRGEKFLATIADDLKNQRVLLQEDNRQRLEEDKYHLEVEEKLRNTLDALILCANSRIVLIEEKGALLARIGELLAKIKDLEEAFDEYKKGTHATESTVGQVH
jgi:hypothetical protein